MPLGDARAQACDEGRLIASGDRPPHRYDQGSLVLPWPFLRLLFVLQARFLSRATARLASVAAAADVHRDAAKPWL